ncbi:MAG: rod shape-determining protein MreC [bacterium]|nr:rod shape-determining protein MreC [bacterium]
MIKSSFQLSKRMKFIVLLVALAAILLMINYLGLDGRIKNVLFSVSSPLQNILWEQGQKTNSFLETIREIGEIKKKSEELELKNQELKAEIARLNGLKSENETLRKALNLGLEREFQLLMANVTGKDPFSDVLLIDKGSDNGLTAGSAVITPEKVLIGLVQEVFPGFSRVSLLSDKKSLVSAQVQAENEEIVGVAKGQGNFKIAFNLIPQDKKIRTGDLLVTTTLGNFFPKGLLIGEIVQVDESDVKPFQTAQVKPAFDIENLKVLFVITGFTP